MLAYKSSHYFCSVSRKRRRCNENKANMMGTKRRDKDLKIKQKSMLEMIFFFLIDVIMMFHDFFLVIFWIKSILV